MLKYETTSRNIPHLTPSPGPFPFKRGRGGKGEGWIQEIPPSPFEGEGPRRGEGVERGDGPFRNVRILPALRVKLSQFAKPRRAPREAFATCETVARVAGNFRNVRNRGACRGKLSQRAKIGLFREAIFRSLRKLVNLTFSVNC